MGQGQTWKKQNKKQDAANFFSEIFLQGFQEQQQCPDLQLKKRAISKIA